MRKLTHSELQDLVSWFTHYMPGEMRLNLMGDLPSHYAVLYPGVNPEVITAQVSRRITQKRSQIPAVPSSVPEGL